MVVELEEETYAAADGSRFVLLLSTAEQVAARQRTHVTMVVEFVEVSRQATAGSAR